MEYNGGPLAAHCFLEMNYEKSSKILDIGAGTGIVGEILAKHGYTHVDALDGNPDMLNILKEKKCYRNVILSMVGPEVRLPVKDREYDVVIMAGVFCPGHIEVKSLEQILRLVTPGKWEVSREFVLTYRKLTFSLSLSLSLSKFSL